LAVVEVEEQETSFQVESVLYFLRFRAEAVAQEISLHLPRFFRMQRQLIMFAVLLEQVELRMLVEMAVQRLFRRVLVIFKRMADWVQ
jgi:hypothetical protein